MMTRVICDDADARQAIKDDLDTTLVVEAAAGTGKTTELVNRILRVLATGRAKMIEIVAVTFTEKAAGELKLRLRAALEHARATADGDADGPIDRLRNAGRMLAEWRDFPRSWTRPAFDRAATIDRLVQALHQLADLTSRASSDRDNLFVDTDGVRRLSRQIQLEQSVE